MVMEPSTLIEPLIQTTEGLCLDGRTPVCWDKLSFKYGDHFWEFVYIQLQIHADTYADTYTYTIIYIYIYIHIYIYEYKF